MQSIVGMSAKERGRGHVIRLVMEKRLRQKEAAERLGIGERQVIRLVKRWRKEAGIG